MNPHKQLLLHVLSVIYVLLTIAVFLVALPQWLRQDDTLVNVIGTIAAASWITVSVYLVSLYRAYKAKSTEKENQPK